MLSCGACQRRILQTIVGFPITTVAPSSTAARRRQISKKPFTSIAASRLDAETGSSLRDDLEPWEGVSDQYRNLSNVQKNTEGPEADEDGEGSGKLVARTKRDIKTAPNWVVQKQLQYLKDPLKLADYVVRRCQNGGFEEAQEVVRAASKYMACTVSWNHLIDYQMSQSNINSAFKTYHEMKKRRQIPDARTYTVIITGCTHHPDIPIGLQKGIALYRSMQMDNSAVKPNQIHINAILKLCAQARDIPAMFDIAADLPSKGPGSLDNVAFTTILNAIYRDANLDSRLKLTRRQTRSYVQKRLLNARRIWAEITQRWRKGDLWVDEELVCAMGRILLLGDGRDRDDVLTMIEHAMNIPRQVPRLGTDERARIQPSEQETYGTRIPSLEASKSDKELRLPIDVQEVQSNTSLKPRGQGLGSFAKPSQTTLTLIMEALLDVSLKAPALKYWHLFTEELGIVPDAPNYHSLLRILREARASSETLNLIQSIPRRLLAEKVFRIAISTCRRDARNPNAFANAGKILDIMTPVIRYPDAKTLIDYLNISTSLPRRVEKQSTPYDPGPTKYSQGRQILRALQRINSFWLNLAATFKYDAATSRRDLKRQADDLLYMSANMVRAYDILMDRALVPRGDYSVLIEKKKKLQAAITRVKGSKLYEKWMAPKVEEIMQETEPRLAEERRSDNPESIGFEDANNAVEVEQGVDINSLEEEQDPPPNQEADQYVPDKPQTPKESPSRAQEVQILGVERLQQATTMHRERRKTRGERLEQVAW